MLSHKKYDVLVFILRGQPLHNAHLEIIKRSTALTDNLVVVVGSARQPRTYKNPFTFDERRTMLKAATSGLSINIFIEPNIDTLYNDQAWASRVQSIVGKYTSPNGKIGIIGHKKDMSTHYLNMFPQWELEEVGMIEPLNATDIRDLYFKWDFNSSFIKYVVPESTYDFMIEFRNTEAFVQIVREREFIAAYKKQYANLPYPPIFVTSDVVVIQSGHILMVKRRAEPGKNLMALPGGYVNAITDKSVEDAALRELKEETMIKVPEPVLRGNIKRNRVFDAIDRSPRGRIITHCFVIELPDGDLPKVKGSDDAIKAKWIPISDIKIEDCFEDHAEIISWAVGANLT